MSRLGLTLAVTLWPATLAAQLGEVHLGAVAGYGTAGSYQAGGGLVGGISAGRLVYAGARWMYYAGGTDRRADSTGSYDVQTQAQIFAADFGLQYPAGKVEIVVGATIGATRYGQESQSTGTRATPTSTARVATEFLIAPNLSVQFRVRGLLLIPEVMYSLSGSPDLRWPASYQGFMFGLRVVVPIEVDRNRY